MVQISKNFNILSEADFALIKPKSDLDEKSKNLLFISNGDFIITKSLKSVGFDSVKTVPEFNINKKQQLASWTFFVIPSLNLWVDVLVESDTPNLENIISFDKKKSIHTECQEFLNEISRQVSLGFKDYLNDGETDLYIPKKPKKVPTGNINTLRNYKASVKRTVFELNGVKLSVTLFIHHQKKNKKTLGLLREQDVTTQSILIPNSDLVLLNKGIMLNNNWIQKLRGRFLHHEDDVKLSVMTPPQIVNLFI